MVAWVKVLLRTSPSRTSAAALPRWHRPVAPPSSGHNPVRHGVWRLWRACSRQWLDCAMAVVGGRPVEWTCQGDSTRATEAPSETPADLATRAQPSV